MNQSGKTLEEIVSSVKRVTDIIAEISAASQEQASGLDQVNKAVMSMDETTQQNAALVEETTSAAQSMRQQARELMQQVQRFQTNQADRPEAAQRLMRREASQVGIKPVTQANGPKGIFPKPAVGKSVPHKEPAGAVAGLPAAMQAGNGKERHSTGDAFEEF